MDTVQKIQHMSDAEPVFDSFSSLPAAASEPVAFTPAKLRADIFSAIKQCLPPQGDALHDAATHHFASGGKALRGLLAMSAGERFGVPRCAALDWALAIEFLHNASLVHDDLCDDDPWRRTRPSVWAAFGRPTAICLGDWMIGKSFEHACAAQRGHPDSRLGGLLADTLARLSDGQAREFSHNAGGDMEAYEAIVSGKTNPLFVAAVEGILRLADRDGEAHVDACRKLFSHVGIAYQIANDLDDHHAALAGRTDGDLRRNAPNAVYIAYREGLSASEAAAFDEWRQTADPQEAGAWLTRIDGSKAEHNATAVMQAHLAAVEAQCSALTPEMDALLLPILSFLAKSQSQPHAQDTTS